MCVTETASGPSSSLFCILDTGARREYNNPSEQGARMNNTYRSGKFVEDRSRDSRADDRSSLSRRDLLGGIGALSALSAASSLFGQGSRDGDGIPLDKRPVPPLTAKGGAIDVHHHF